MAMTDICRLVKYGRYQVRSLETSNSGIDKSFIRGICTL